MQWLALPSGKRGRSRTFSEAAIQFCLSEKCLFSLALRQSIGMVSMPAQSRGLGDWLVPDLSTLSRRQKDLENHIGYRASPALHLLVYSTCVKMLGEGEWKRKKH